MKKQNNAITVGASIARPFIETQGITLIALIITIIVMLILIGVSITLFSEHGLIEHAKMSKFSTEFREVEEMVEIYTSNEEIQEIVDGARTEGKVVKKSVRLASNLPEEEEKRIYRESSNKSTKMILPVSSKLSQEEKEEIKNNKVTLQAKIEELSGKQLEEVNLYWIDKEKVGTKVPHKYIIDIDTRQIYDYQGMSIYGLMWHTLDGGVKNGTTPSAGEKEEIWDGWIKLTLYYPSGSTERKWRIGEEGQTRYDENLMWQDYTGPITVRLSDVENVWIKYTLNGEEQIIAPNGRLAVDIQPDSYYPTMTDKVKIKIYYDKGAELKQYKIGNSQWQDYEGEFYVTENTIVEARAKKTENISDSQGNVIGTKEIWGRDNIYVGNIGIEETELVAPTIIRKAPDSSIENEVAKVEVKYPEGAARKIYKINYGIEQEYTEDISITKYGTYVIAYYYDANGKRSKSKAIYIGEKETEPEDYTPNKPGKPTEGGSSGSNPTEPSYVIEAPIINVSPTTVTSSVQVSIRVPAGQTADKIYYKIGDNDYEEYAGAFSINYNTTITAYYKTLKGENSSKARKRINNIQEAGKPYVGINLEKDPYDAPYGQTKVTATITTKDADKVEYSMNGIEYQEYTTPIEITKNCRLYAKATNSQGWAVEYVDITNIKGAPQKQDKLTVSIQVNPEPKLTNELVESVEVSIEYDERATNNYYKIGENGELQKYTGPFTIKSNCTIYAYATSDNGKGSNTKQIDNITTGISEPEIIAYPRNNKQSTKTQISINFDRTANITRYKIDGGSYIDYTGTIEITKNCTITAYNKNKLGYEATSTYQITNIVPETPTIVIDKGKYYIIKLNYPEGSTGREYKWQEEEWKSYKEEGILLIKPEYKDEIIGANGNIKIKIEDETGKQIDFKGDYYFITKPIQELMENVALRWDRTTPQAPTIIQNTEEPTKEVKVAINYSSSLLVQQYKIVEPDGTSTGWQNYTGVITITKKNTVIYAKGQDEAQVWSDQAMKKVTNIDEEPPVIKVTADLKNTKQKVGIKIEVTDDVRVENVMWAKGIQKESYFANAGNSIQNNSIIYATENGYYTIYASDSVGNKSTYTLQVQNIDNKAPDINITVKPDNTIVSEVEISIDYGDSSIKQYKIGESNQTWTNYTETIKLTSNTVLANGWKNEDNTVTIYAKGKDAVGNENIVTEKILSLDLDAPKTPIIESNYGYPVLTEYGVKVDGETKITYDTRNDIDNYYSIDNGATWQKYTGSFELPGAGTIIAKSVKKSSGLEVITSKEVNMPSDALGPAAYDGDESTYISKYGKNYYINVDESVQGEILSYGIHRSDGGCYTTVTFYLKDGTTEVWKLTGATGGTKSNPAMATYSHVIPEGCYKISYYEYQYGTSRSRLYEIGIFSKPKLNFNQCYPKITNYGVEKEHAKGTIQYFPTSVQRLYRIDDGEWKNYQDKEIRLEIGETIYAKGIDKYGKDTIIVSYTATQPSDMLPIEAYDRDESTYISKYGKNYYLAVDEAQYGELLSYGIHRSDSGCYTTITFYLKDGTTEVWKLTGATGGTKSNPAMATYSHVIPEGCYKISYSERQYGTSRSRLYEIGIFNKPKLNFKQHYPEITNYGVEKEHASGTIEYFPTSVQRLYKIDDGEWKNYQDKEIRLEVGQTIYAKGIDKYGTETIITSFTMSKLSNALNGGAYDNNIETYEKISNGTSRRIDISSELWGKQVSLTLNSANAGAGYVNKVEMKDSSGNVTWSYNIAKPYTWTNKAITVPNDTQYIEFTANRFDGRFYFDIKEVGPYIE